MPNFWQFPTVSMGLGPLQAIYQAQFLKYLENRGFLEEDNRKIWMFCGDGEMDEVESLGALTLGSREKLDNLIFVINCNLQRLDGPVRGNSKIIEELEGVFSGAGWNVIKVIWGSQWDELFAKDKQAWILKRINECVDGEYQNFQAKGPVYFREHFFGKYPELEALVADMSDEELGQLLDGGHDPQKVYAAYAAAVKHKDQPTVILAKTVKGFGMGAAGEGLNVAHQQKKMDLEAIRAFRDRFNIPVSDQELENIPYCKPEKDSPEMQYLQRRRKALGGYLPARYNTAPRLAVPKLEEFASVYGASDGREFSTTMAFVRILTLLLKDKNLGKNIVPIVADESRTFGMEGLFRQIGIYSPVGQLYEPEDKKQLMYYREAKDGQILQEGINEAGAFAAWIAAATSYSTNDLQMIPFYIFYSMFGFQRVGDLAWAAGDIRARGFLLGATAGRTTLAGEGLQHQDGHNIVFFSTVPNCVCYDPTYAYELAVIMQDGLRRMVQEQEDVYYYIAVMNENYQHPELPKDKAVVEGIIKGMYQLKKRKAQTKLVVQLLGAGTILREVEAAAEILEEDYGVTADIWSVPSFSELHKEAQDIDRYNALHPKAKQKVSYVAKCLQDQPGPIIAATDYIRLYAEQIRAYIPQKNYYVLGTDGFGRSDTRKKLRHFFEVDAKMIVYMSLKALKDEGKITLDKLMTAMEKLGIDPEKPNPLKV
jgi:pyruvate dehydrogenase E1 component